MLFCVFIPHVVLELLWSESLMILEVSVVSNWPSEPFAARFEFEITEKVVSYKRVS